MKSQRSQRMSKTGWVISFFTKEDDQLFGFVEIRREKKEMDAVDVAVRTMLEAGCTFSIGRTKANPIVEVQDE